MHCSLLVLVLVLPLLPATSHPSSRGLSSGLRIATYLPLHTFLAPASPFPAALGSKIFYSSTPSEDTRWQCGKSADLSLIRCFLRSPYLPFSLCSGVSDATTRRARPKRRDLPGLALPCLALPYLLPCTVPDLGIIPYYPFPPHPFLVTWRTFSREAGGGGGGGRPTLGGGVFLCNSLISPLLAWFVMGGRTGGGKPSRKWMKFEAEEEKGRIALLENRGAAMTNCHPVPHPPPPASPLVRTRLAIVTFGNAVVWRPSFPESTPSGRRKGQTAETNVLCHLGFLPLMAGWHIPIPPGPLFFPLLQRSRRQPMTGVGAGAGAGLGLGADIGVGAGCRASFRHTPLGQALFFLLFFFACDGIVYFPFPPLLRTIVAWNLLRSCLVAAPVSLRAPSWVSLRIAVFFLSLFFSLPCQIQGVWITLLHLRDTGSPRYEGECVFRTPASSSPFPMINRRRHAVRLAEKQNEEPTMETIGEKEATTANYTVGGKAKTRYTAWLASFSRHELASCATDETDDPTPARRTRLVSLSLSRVLSRLLSAGLAGSRGCALCYDTSALLFFFLSFRARPFLRACHLGREELDLKRREGQFSARVQRGRGRRPRSLAKVYRAPPPIPSPGHPTGLDLTMNSALVLVLALPGLVLSLPQESSCRGPPAGLWGLAGAGVDVDGPSLDAHGQAGRIRRRLTCRVTFSFEGGKRQFDHLILGFFLHFTMGWLDGMYGDPLDVALVWTVGISSHYRREARKQVFDAKRDFRTMSCFPELGGLGLDSGLGRDDIPRLPNHPLIRAPFRRNMFVLRKREGVDPGPPCPVPCSLHAPAVRRSSDLRDKGGGGGGGGGAGGRTNKNFEELKKGEKGGGGFGGGGGGGGLGLHEREAKKDEGFVDLVCSLWMRGNVIAMQFSFSSGFNLRGCYVPGEINTKDERTTWMKIRPFSSSRGISCRFWLPGGRLLRFVVRRDKPDVCLDLEVIRMVASRSNVRHSEVAKLSKAAPPVTSSANRGAPNLLLVSTACDVEHELFDGKGAKKNLELSALRNIFTSLEDMIGRVSQVPLTCYDPSIHLVTSSPICLFGAQHFPTDRRDYTKDHEYLGMIRETHKIEREGCNITYISHLRSLAVQKAFRLQSPIRIEVVDSKPLPVKTRFTLLPHLEPAGTGLGYHDKSIRGIISDLYKIMDCYRTYMEASAENLMTSRMTGDHIHRINFGINGVLSISKPRDVTAFISRYLMCYTASLTETLVFISPMPPVCRAENTRKDGFRRTTYSRSNLPLNHAPGHESAMVALTRQPMSNTAQGLTVDFEVCSRLLTVTLARIRETCSVKPFALIPSKPSTRRGKPVAMPPLERGSHYFWSSYITKHVARPRLVTIEFSAIVYIPNKSKSSSMIDDKAFHFLTTPTAFNHSQPPLRIFDTRRNVVTDPSVSAGGPTEPSEEPRDPPLRGPPIIVALPDLGQNPHGITHLTIKSAAGWGREFKPPTDHVPFLKFLLWTDRVGGERSLQFNNLEKMSQSASGLWDILPAMAILSPHAEGMQKTRRITFEVENILEGIQPNSLLERLKHLQENEIKKINCLK
ncbi:hypothetical protein CCUS01_15194 [Colletotrichum cuscutae]|uniref:Uncharacterized protein n=1 Tax=Colletotrichum cuscutae TaxID=1209917 RepID=A0AAI9VHU8_9PEZI|nr:hypothetical protein CCUS01_15194 [Colletotrichum cuscutae]